MYQRQGHADVAHALRHARHTAGGIGHIDFDCHVRIDGVIGFLQLFHNRRHRGRAADADFAGRLRAVVCAVGLDGNVAVVLDDLLSLVGEDEGDEIRGGLGGLCLLYTSRCV